MWFVPIITIVLVCSVSVGEAEPQKSELELLCSKKDVELTRKSQLEAMFKDGNSTVPCPDTIFVALLEINKITSIAAAHACSWDTVIYFRNYYLNHWYRSKKEPKINLPKALKKYVLALGMQLSKNCKQSMLDWINNGKLSSINKDDLDRLDIWAKKDGPLRRLLMEMNEPGEIILPNVLAAIMAQADLTTIGTIYVQSSATKTIRKYKETCQKRFQPIYKPMILPINVLADIGFDYKDKEMKAAFQVPAEKILTWTNIVFFCEALKMVEPVEYLDAPQVGGDVPIVAADDVEPEQSEWDKLDDSRKIRLLTKQEADAINELIESDAKYAHLRSYEELEEVPRRVNFAKLKDLIYDKQDKELVKQIKNFKTNKSQLELAKGKLIRSCMITLRTLLKKRKLKVLATSAAKAYWSRLRTRKETSQEDINKSLVAMVEKIADQSIAVSREWQTNHYVMFAVTMICALALLGLTLTTVISMVIAGVGVVGALLGAG